MQLRVISSYRPAAGRAGGFSPVRFGAGMDAQGGTVWVLELYYRRLLLALAIMIPVGWLLAATALFFWLNSTPHNQVGWFDLAAPWRWSGLRARRGDTAILTAVDELKAREYTNAYYNLRVGLARSPGNVDGRMALARLQIAFEPARAVSLLEEGIPYSGDDPKFLSGLLAAYAGLQVHAHALEVIEQLLQTRKTTLPAEVRFLLERTRVAQLIQLQRLPEAEQALREAAASARPEEQAAWHALEIEYLLRAGRAQDARNFSDEHPAPANAPAGRLRLDAEVAVELGDADRLQSLLRRMKAAAPNDPGVYLYSFQAWHRIKRLSFRDAAEKEYYRIFAANDAALQALAALAVNLNLPEIIFRAQRVAVAARLSPFAYRVHQTELALRNGDTEQATRLLREWENNIDTLKPLQRFYPEFLKRLVRAAFTGTPDQVDYLQAHLAAGRGLAQLPVYLLAVTVLEKAGNPAGADRILQGALRLFPQSDPLLLLRPELEKQLAATAAATAAAKPATAIRLLPATGAEAIGQVDGCLERDELTAARDLLRAIRAQKPAWLPLVEAEVAQREVELAFFTLDPLSARAVARTYLDRYREEEALLRLVRLVPRLIERERTAGARVLYDELAATTTASVRVQLALKALNLTDDLAATVADPATALAALDRLVLTEQWAQAERLLKYLREKPPGWLAAGQTEVSAREVEIRLGLGQRPQAFGALKELVIKGGAARSAAFKLVRDRVADGRFATAVVLAREIVRLLPGDPAAARLLQEAEAPRPADP